MTETQRWCNEVCDGLVKHDRVRLYRDLYKDLREQLPCGDACRLIEAGLRLSRTIRWPEGSLPAWHTMGDRARAIAAVTRLARYAADHPHTRCPDCGGHRGTSTHVDGCCSECVGRRLLALTEEGA